MAILLKKKTWKVVVFSKKNRKFKTKQKELKSRGRMSNQKQKMNWK